METFPKKIIFLPDALSEAREAYDWYENREKGLGEGFSRALSTALNFVARNPQAARVSYKTFHRVLLRRFPYAVFYNYDEEKI